MYNNTEMDFHYYETMSRTAWGMEESSKHLKHSLSRMHERITIFENLIPNLVNTSKKRIYYGMEIRSMKNLYNLISIREVDYRISSTPLNEINPILPCKDFSSLAKETIGEYIVFVLPQEDNWNAIKNLEQLGLKRNSDFYVIPCIFLPEQGGYL